MNRQSCEIKRPKKPTNYNQQYPACHKSVTQQNWDRRQSSLHRCMLNKEATEHYIIEKVHTSVCTGGNPALYIHYKNKCQYCMRRYPVYAGGNPAQQMLVNQVRSMYIITQAFLPSQIIVAHLFPHVNIVPPLHIVTFETEGS